VPLRLFLLGGLALNLTIIAYIGENTDAACLARPWLLNITASAMFSPLLAKLYRVVTLFNAKLKKVTVSDIFILGLCAGAVSVDCFLLLLWSLIKRPKMKIVSVAYSGVYQDVDNRVCSTDLTDPFEIVLVIWKTILLGLGVFYAIRAWNLPAKLSEAKHFAIAIYNITVVGGLAYFVSYLIASNSPDAAVLLRILGIFSTPTVAIIVIMGSKLWEIRIGAPINPDYSASSPSSYDERSSVNIDQSVHFASKSFISDSNRGSGK